MALLNVSLTLLHSTLATVAFLTLSTFAVKMYGIRRYVRQLQKQGLVCLYPWNENLE